jgi:hypothetical protein
MNSALGAIRRYSRTSAARGTIDWYVYNVTNVFIFSTILLRRTILQVFFWSDYWFLVARAAEYIKSNESNTVVSVEMCVLRCCSILIFFFRRFTTYSFSFFLFRSRPVWTSSPEISAGYNKLRSWVAMADSMFETYKAPPAPIDFTKANKSVRDKAFVSTLESFYKSNQPPVETHVMPESEIQHSEETIAYLKELDTLNKEFLPVLEKEIEFYETTRTTKETTVFEMRVNYPLIHEEIENELEDRDWYKDSGIGAGGK